MPLDADGKFHALEVRPRSKKGSTIRARKGYYAPTALGSRPGPMRAAGEPCDFSVQTGGPSAIRRTLIATALGGSSFFRAGGSRNFAPFRFRMGQARIRLSQVSWASPLELSAGWTKWWKRALVFGLAFSIPSSCGAFALGPGWMPYSIAAITEGLVVALLIAFLADNIFPHRLESSDHRSFGLVRRRAATRQ